MIDEALIELRTKVGARQTEDKVSHEKRLKLEIQLIKVHATIVSESKGKMVCEGAFGRVVVEQKEATLFDAVTSKPIRSEPFKSHLYAVHRAMCWSVLGMYENRFGDLQ